MAARSPGALLAASLLIGATSAVTTEPPASPAPGVTPERAVIGTVGAQQITAGDIVDRNREVFAQLQTARDQKLHRVELEYGRTFHELMQRDLEVFLDQRALELEAGARHTTPEALKATVKVPPVTEEEVRAFYDSRKAQIGQPYEQVSSAIRQYLAEERVQAAFRSYYDTLRARHGITTKLEPYRLPVAASGPARGPVSAPVTIVEFGDFQCPYCRQAESELHSVLANHPQDVRLVFRNLPLGDLHPDALIAARAGVCADRQGKFWELHDAMFADQRALAAEALEASSTRLGLDSKSFAQCLDDAAATAAVLDADTRAAAELGLDGTPYFFINGRPLHGVGTPERFETIISEELGKASAGAASAR